MDSVIAAAGRALAVGDPLGALKRVALRDDAPGLALRGIAMAQLGDLSRARELLRKAARAFGPKEAVARARCIVAEAEIAFVTRELSWAGKALNSARETLEMHGDWVNAAHARYLDARRLLLIGRVDEAEGLLTRNDSRRLHPALKTTHELVLAEIAMRRLQTRPARAALERAQVAANQSGIPALVAEVEKAVSGLVTPAARVVSHGEERPVVLEEVETLLASKAFVVDACRYVIQDEGKVVPLVKRPVLFTLARTLAEAWPEDVPRDALVETAFRLRAADDSNRARLRVEIARLRRVLRTLATVSATKRGFALVPDRAREVVVLARPVAIEERHASVLAFLADGESWSTSALALALGTSQRTVQRAIDSLALSGKVQSFGRGRTRRWVTPPLPGFATTLLLPGPLPID